MEADGDPVNYMRILFFICPARDAARHGTAWRRRAPGRCAECAAFGAAAGALAGRAAALGRIGGAAAACLGESILRCLVHF